MRMDREKCKQYEVAIVDSIMGNLPPDCTEALQQHLATCPSCTELYKEWRELLEDGKEATPSVHLYQRLKRSVTRQKVKNKIFRPSTFWGIVSVATAILLFIGIHTLYQEKTRMNSFAQLVDEHLPPSMFMDARTVQYTISPQNGPLIGVHGNIWVNGHTDEVFFRVHGLKEDTEHDYQVWLIKSVNRENAGLLDIVGEYAEFYSQGQNIHEVQHISISKEPKGGSDYPTTPDVILLDLRHMRKSYP